MPAHLKHPKVRQRKNKESTAADLKNVAPLVVGTALPTHRNDWLPQVKDAWSRIWKSPMADEFCAEDIILLTAAIEALQQYYEKPSVKNAKVIMGIFQPFGLSPLDRRRLGWAFKKPDGATKAPTPHVPESTVDPRDVLDKVH